MKEITFSTHMKAFRAKLGWTQEMLAQKVGVTRETITYLEKGKYNPSLKLAYCVAKALGTTLNELYEFEKEVSS